MTYTQADFALMREMHIDMGEPYERVTIFEAPEAECVQMARHSDYINASQPVGGAAGKGEFHHGNIDRESSASQDGKPVRLQEVKSSQKSSQDRSVGTTGTRAQESRYSSDWKLKQDMAKCAAIRESTRVREDQRSGARALSAAIWIGVIVMAIAGVVWMAVWHG